MSSHLRWAAALLLVTTSMAAQKTTTTRRPARQAADTTQWSAMAEELRAIREQMAAQQRQLDQMQQQLQSRDAAIRQLQEQVQSTQATATSAEQKAGAAAESSSAVTALKSQVEVIKLNQTNAAVSVQEDQKRWGALESTLGRFRWSGDVRVRQEDFFQDYSGCATCVPRIRERIRLRFGFESRLNDDFLAGVFLASGTLVDATSTNETLTSVFERKTVGFDRGSITYNPKAHNWLNLTGGKFAYTWIRTNSSLDPDLNPEGFSEKFSFNLNDKVLKNVTFTGMQLLFNEVAAPVAASNCLAGFNFCANGGNLSGNDSFAAGGQVSAKLQLGHRISVTPSYTILNWRNADTLLNQPASVTGSTGITTVGSSSTFTSSPFAFNGLTNATVRVGTAPNGAPILRFLSRFLYSDLILDTSINTGHPRLPWRVVLEYLDNLNAVDHPVNAAGVSLTGLGRQSHLYLVETSVGRLSEKNDVQFTYSWWRQEQDSVLGAFNESDQRAPTNIVQNKFIFKWNMQRNVEADYTLWIGRTLNSNLINARLAPGLAAGARDPYLKRMQFDVIYKF